jgi:DNA repair protein RecO (recombination protein O)
MAKRRQKLVTATPGMKTPRIYRTEALIIKHFDYGEADRILTLYTPRLGKISAIAKGVRRPKSRMGGHLDLFTRSVLLLAQGRNLDIVTQAQALHYFTILHNDLLRSGYAHYIAELLDAFTPERLPNEALYRATLLALHRLGGRGAVNGVRPIWVVRAFEMRLLSLSGYQPQLHRCLSCGEAIMPQTNRFSVTLGGTLCPNCGPIDAAAPDISVPALKVLRNLQTNEEAVLGLQSVDDTVAHEVERCMHEYIEYRLEKRPKSIAVLEKLRG